MDADGYGAGSDDTTIPGDDEEAATMARMKYQMSTPPTKLKRRSTGSLSSKPKVHRRMQSSRIFKRLRRMSTSDCIPQPAVVSTAAKSMPKPRNNSPTRHAQGEAAANNAKQGTTPANIKDEPREKDDSSKKAKHETGKKVTPHEHKEAAAALASTSASPQPPVGKEPTLEQQPNLETDLKKEEPQSPKDKHTEFVRDTLNRQSTQHLDNSNEAKQHANANNQQAESLGDKSKEATQHANANKQQAKPDDSAKAKQKQNSTTPPATTAEVTPTAQAAATESESEDENEAAAKELAVRRKKDAHARFMRFSRSLVSGLL